MFELGIVGRFEAAHRLHGDFGPATRRHGHTYRVEVRATGRQLREDGTLFDITRLQAALDEVTASLHYRDLDEIPALAGRNTTAEVMAQFIFDSIAPRFNGLGLSRLSVRVWESPDAYASYTEDVP